MTRQSDKDRDEGPAKGLRLAEWVTLGLSIGMIALLAGALLRIAGKEEVGLVFPTTRVILEDVREGAGRFALPIEVENKAGRSLTNLRIGVGHGAGAERVERVVTMDYLTAAAKKRVIVLFDSHPRDLGVQGAVLSYETP